ncbi:retrotransposon protein, putative, ty1-copia subclass [Tanacetum coccineum]
MVSCAMRTNFILIRGFPLTIAPTSSNECFLIIKEVFGTITYEVIWITTLRAPSIFLFLFVFLHFSDVLFVVMSLRWIQSIECHTEEDPDNETHAILRRSSHKPFKVEARIDIPSYDGTIDAEKLDSRIDQLETYFTLYGLSSTEKVSFARHKLTSHALAWWNFFLKMMLEEGKVNMGMISNEIYAKNFILWDIHKINGHGGIIFDNNAGNPSKSTLPKFCILVTKEKEELFTLKIQVKQEVIEAIIDIGCEKNLISSSLVDRLGLETTPHPRPYSLGWIKKDI